MPLTNIYHVCLLRAIERNGGVLFADTLCTNVTISNSTFVGNSAGAGAVAFLEGWSPEAAAARPPLCPGTSCQILNNTALFWGASTVAASPIATSVATLSRRTVSSGGVFSASVALFDGFGTPVTDSLPGVTFEISCANCSRVANSALNGAATAKYEGITRVGELSIVGPQRAYALAVTVGQNDQFINTTLETTAVMTVVACSATEVFDSASGVCICIGEY